jgi:hypothetical protein
MKRKVGTFAPDGTMLPPKRKTRSDKGKPRKQKEPVKKRHRRTKAELLQDPVYRKKHGLDAPKITDIARIPTMKKGSNGKTIAKIEEEHLIRAYHEWEKVQGVINGMDAALSAVLRRSDPKPREFIAFDHAAGAMEDAFAAFETAIDERREME